MCECHPSYPNTHIYDATSVSFQIGLTPSITVCHSHINQAADAKASTKRQFRCSSIHKMHWKLIRFEMFCLWIFQPSFAIRRNRTRPHGTMIIINTIYSRRVYVQVDHFNVVWVNRHNFACNRLNVRNLFLMRSALSCC